MCSVIVYMSGTVSFCGRIALDELFKFVEQLFRLSYRTKLLRFQMWRQSSWQMESDLTKRSSQATVLPGVVIRTLHPLHSTQSSSLNSTGAETLACICPAVKRSLQTTTTIQAHEWSLTNQTKIYGSISEGKTCHLIEMELKIDITVLCL